MFTYGGRRAVVDNHLHGICFSCEVGRKAVKGHCTVCIDGDDGTDD